MPFDELRHHWRVLCPNNSTCALRHQALANRALSAPARNVNDAPLGVQFSVGFPRQRPNSYPQVRSERIAIGHQPAFDHADRKAKLEALCTRGNKLTKRDSRTDFLFKISEPQDKTVPTGLVVFLGKPPERMSRRIPDNQIVGIAPRLTPKNLEHPFIEIALDQCGNQDQTSAVPNNSICCIALIGITTSAAVNPCASASRMSR